jgi:hypothetical protein
VSRWRRALAGLGTATLLVLTSLTGGGVAVGMVVPDDEPVRSHAPTVTPARDRAIITLTDVEPIVVAPGETVTIHGVVTAPTVGALLGATLRVVHGSTRLDRREAVDAWAKETDAAAGSTVVLEDLPTVDAGQSRDFTVSFPAARVASPEAFAAVPLSLEVTPKGAAQPAGVTRTFLSWQSRKEYVPLQISMVLPVTLDADLNLFSRNGDTRANAWRGAIGSDSRVRRIIDGSSGHEVTLAVDPSVFGPSVGTSAPPPLPAPGPSPSGTPDGSLTGTPSGTPSPPTGETTATDPPTPDATDPGHTRPGTPVPTKSSATDPGTTDPATPDPTPPATPTPTASGTPPVPPPLSGAVITRLGDDLVSRLRDRTVWALPYADADLAAAVAVDPTNAVIRDLVNRSSIVPQRLGRPVPADVVLPVDGLLPPGRAAAVTELLRGTSVAKPAALVVNSAAITSPTAYTPTARRVSADGTRLVGYDPALSALLPGQENAGVLDRQRFLAETLALLDERPGTPRSLLLLAPRTYDPDPTALRDLLGAIDAAPWLQPVPAADLLVDSGGDAAAPTQRAPAKLAPAAPAATLTATRLRAMAEQRETLRRVATVLRDGAQFEATYRELLDELASARWRWDPEDWPRLAASVSSDVQGATRAIRVVPRSFNFLAEQGTLTLTVENGLDFTVDDIRLVLAPTNPRMQVVQQPAPISIGAGSKRSVKITVRAVAAGQADIRAFLTTADGTPIGQPAVIPISANPLDRTIYGVGGAILGLILLAGLARTLLKGTSRIDEIDDPDALTDGGHEGHGG